jgi:threonine/homoserine/homoserine lactone efflux protein
MVPLALANVLLNDLLARPESSLVPAVAMLVVAVVYVAALTRLHESLVMVLQVLGVSNLLLLAVCAWFSRRAKPIGAPAR